MFHCLLPLGEELPRTVYEAWLWFGLNDSLLYLLHNILLQLNHSAASPILVENYQGHLAFEPTFGVPDIFLLGNVQIVRAGLLHSHQTVLSVVSTHRRQSTVKLCELIAYFLHKISEPLLVAVEGSRPLV